MPTIDVQSFSEQQKQKDLMKESNKALEATKEVKPEQEEPKQVQEPVVKEEVVKEEPVKELPSMDNKEEAKQDIVVDVEDAMNTTPMEDFTKDDDSGMSLLERMYGVKEDRFLVEDMSAVKRWDAKHRSWLGKTVDVAKNFTAGVSESLLQTSKIPYQLAVWYGTAGAKSGVKLGETMVNWANDTLNNIDYFIKETSPFDDVERGSLSYNIGGVIGDVVTSLGVSAGAKAATKRSVASYKTTQLLAETKLNNLEKSGLGHLVANVRRQAQLKGINYKTLTVDELAEKVVEYYDKPFIEQSIKAQKSIKRLTKAVADSPMHFVMTKDVGSMMESRLAQYRDERGEIDMVQWLKDANQNLAGTLTYGALAWLTEAKFGLGWIMKNAKTPTAEITLEALQALRGGKDFVSRMATKNTLWTYYALSTAKESATEALQEIEQIGTEWLYKLKERNPEDGSLEYREKKWKTELTRILQSAVIGGVMGGTVSYGHVAMQKKAFVDNAVPMIMEANSNLSEVDATKMAKQIFTSYYTGVAPDFAKEQEVKMSFASGNGVEFQKFVDFIESTYKANNIEASGEEIVAQANRYSDNLYNLCNALGIPMNDWAKHITAKTFVTKENVIGLQFLYDGKPLTEYGSETYQHKEARNIDRENITEEEYGKWEEREVSDFSKEAQAKLQELGIKDKTVWTKKGAEPSVDNIAPSKLANQLTSFKLGEKIDIENVEEIKLPKDANGAYVSSLSAILINPSKANYTTLSHEFGHFFFETMYSAFRNNLLSSKMKGDFTGLLTSMNINPETTPHLTTRQSEALADVFSAYSTGSALKGKVSQVFKANKFEKIADGIGEAYKEAAYKAWKLANRPDVVISPATVDFMKNILGTDMGEVKAQISDKVEIPEGMTKEDYAKDVVSERNPEVVYNNNGEDVSYAHPIAMEAPNGLKSRVYTRTLETLNMEGNPELNLTYQKVTNAEQAAKAAEMVEKNPDKVKEMIITDTVPNDMLRSAMMLAYQNYMVEKGNYSEANKMERWRSLEQTRNGQEIQFERMAQFGRNNITNPALWHKVALTNMMTACVERIGRGKFKSTADLAKWRDGYVKTLAKQVYDGNLSIEEAVSKINKDCDSNILYQKDIKDQAWHKTYVKVYDKISDIVDRALNIKLSEEQVADLNSKVAKLTEKAETFDGKIITEEQAKAIKDLQDTIKALNPSSNLKIMASTISRINLLSNPSTLLTNIISNGASFIPEMIARRIMNFRMNGYVSSSLKKAKYDYAMKVFNAGDLTVATMRPDDITKEIKYKGETTVSSQGEGKVRAFSRFAEKLIFKWGLGYPDAITKSLAFNDAADIYIGKYVDSQLKNGTLAEKKALAEQLFNDVWNINPESDIAKSIREKAILDAEIATYTNKGTLNDLLTKTRTAINKASGDLRLGDILAPFVATPANVIQMGMEYSAGIGYSLYHAKDIAADIRKGEMSEVSRNAITYAVRNGIGVLLTLAIGSLFDDDEYIPPYEACSMAERELVKAEGGVFNSLRIGGRYVSLDYLGVLGVPLAGIMGAKRKGIPGYGISVASQIAQLPVLSQTSEVLKQSEDFMQNPEKGFGELFEKVAESAVARLYPSFLNTVVSIADPYVRETKGLSFIEKLEGRIYPWSLEKKQSFVTGGDIGKGFEDAVYKLLFGGRVKAGLSSNTIEALNTLNLAGELPYIGDFTNRGRFKDYTDAQKQKARETFAREFKKEADKLVRSSAYIRASAKEQKEMISKLRSKIVKGL